MFIQIVLFQEFDRLPKDTTPEIKRSNLSSVLLQVNWSPVLNEYYISAKNRVLGLLEINMCCHLGIKF